MKIQSKTLALVALAFSLLSAASAAVETYAIDSVHSSVGFTVRHFLTKVPGRFSQFSGTIVVDRDNLENSKVNATIDVGSVNTDNEKRNTHLKSPDFFDVAKYETITFASTSWKKTGDTTFDVTGDLTIHGVTKETILKVTSLGFGPGMMGAQLSGWEANVVLDRQDFGVKGPAMLGKALGNEVNVSITIEADLKK